MFKQFDFPGFEEWRANGAPTLRIGNYYASITCDCSKDNIKTYTCSLSTHYLPFNKYVPKIFSMNIRYVENKDNVKLLEEWYNTAIQALNEAFVNHLKKIITRIILSVLQLRLLIILIKVDYVIIANCVEKIFVHHIINPFIWFLFVKTLYEIMIKGVFCENSIRNICSI